MELGTKINTVPGELPKVVLLLSDFGLSIGDLCCFTGYGLDCGGKIYRVMEDCPPRSDAVYGNYKKYDRYPFRGKGMTGKTTRNSRTAVGWCDPVSGQWINPTRLYGCIRLVPVFSFTPESSSTVSYKKVQYSDIQEKIKKLDIVGLSAAFAKFHMFLQEHVKELQGE